MSWFMKTLFYKTILVLLKCYNHFYFKKVRVYGLENIPKNSGLIFSPNHQGAFLDPLLVGTTCGHELNPLTRSDIFRGPFHWFLDALKMLPVYRIRDGFSSLKKNNVIFEMCYDLLRDKKKLMMFSEGSHHNEYFLKRLSKGSSRLALEAQEKYPKTQMYIVPVGINYSHHQMPWQEVHIVYGKALLVGSFLNDYKENKGVTINKLRDALEVGMKKCLWLPDKDDSYLEKKKYVHILNSKLGFFEFKEALVNEQSKLKQAKSGGKSLNVVIKLLGLLNIIPLLMIRKVVRLFSDVVFHNAIKYLFGLIIFALWWVILLLFGIYFEGIYLGVSLFIGSLVLLYLRQEVISTLK